VPDDHPDPHRYDDDRAPEDSSQDERIAHDVVMHAPLADDRAGIAVALEPGAADRAGPELVGRQTEHERSGGDDRRPRESPKEIAATSGHLAVAAHIRLFTTLLNGDPKR
jgi:hypothetical protein